MAMTKVHYSLRSQQPMSLTTTYIVTILSKGGEYSGFQKHGNAGRVQKLFWFWPPHLTG